MFDPLRRLKGAVIALSALSLPLSSTLWVSSSFVAGTPCQAADLAGTFKQGRAYFQSGNYPQAIECFTRCIQISPNASNLWAWRADAYRKMKEYARGVADANKAISLGSTNAPDYYIRGNCYYNLRQFENAVDDLTKAISFNPKNHIYYNDRGAANFGAKKYREAIQDYTSALNLDPNYALGYFNRADTFDNLQEYEHAIEDYNKAISLNPDNATWLKKRAACKGLLKQNKEALEDYNKALSISPKDFTIYVNRGLLYGVMGQSQAALDDMNTAIELNPNNAYTYAYRAKIYVDMKRYQEAVDDASKTIARDPNIWKAYSNRGYAYTCLGNYEAALKDYDRAIALDPQAGTPYRNKGGAYMALGQYKDAIASYDKAISLSKSAECYYDRASANILTGDYSAALQDSEQALRLRPNDGNILGLKSIALSRMGNYQDALSAAEASLRINPNDFCSLREKAIAQIFLRQESEALKTVATAASLVRQGGIHQVMLHSIEALAYARTGGTSKAQGAAERTYKEYNALAPGQRKQVSPYIASLSVAFSLAGDPRTGAEVANAVLSQVKDEDIDSKSLALAARALANTKMSKSLLAEADTREALRSAPEHAFVRELAETAAHTTVYSRPQNSSSGSITSSSQTGGTGINRPIQDKWALIIGISKFEDPSIPALKYASKDALDFANFLVSNCHFQKDHVRVLLNEKATQRRILEELGDRFLPRVAHKDDLVVLYFSGHGSPSRADVKEKNYLIAHDSHKSSLFASGIELQDLTALLKKRVDSDRVLIVLDACHSGAADANAKDGESPANFNVDELAGEGQLVICSSQQSERSWESRRYANGIFTKKLMQGLLQKGSATNLRDAFESTVRSVSEEVKEDQAVHQTPTLKSDWDGNDLKLALPPSRPRSLPQAVKTLLGPDSFSTPQIEARAKKTK